MMKKSWVAFLIMAAASYFLTLLTLFWGAPFIRVLRARFGSLIFWITGAAVSAAFGPLWFVGASTWATLGIFSELEAKGARWFWNGLLSLAVGTGILVYGTFNMLHRQGITTIAELSEAAKTVLTERTLLKIPAEFNFESLVYQLPSIAVISMVLILAHGLIFERPIYTWFRMARERYAAQIRLLEFKLPDVFVWMAMISFLGTTFEWQGQWVATNILNVCVALFFLQGLAVLEYFFKALRVGIFVRALGYFLFVFQLFVVLAFVGFIDFWVDFRNRFRKVSTNENNKNARIL